MSKRNRRRYSEQYRVDAVLMVEAANGDTRKVAKHLKMPEATLRGWYNAQVGNGKKPAHNPVPVEVHNVKNGRLIDELRELLGLHIKHAKDAAQDASLGNLDTGIGIIIDKIQLLSGQPTERHEFTDSARERVAGRIASVAARNGQRGDSSRPIAN